MKQYSLDDSCTSNTDERHQFAQKLFGRGRHSESGDKTSERYRNKDRSESSSGVCYGLAMTLGNKFTRSNLLGCHFDRFVCIAKVDLESVISKQVIIAASSHSALLRQPNEREVPTTYGNIERLVCPLPEDDASERGVGHEHTSLLVSWLRVAILQLWAYAYSAHELNAPFEVSRSSSHQVCRNKGGHSEGKRNRLARIWVNRRVDHCHQLYPVRPGSPLHEFSGLRYRFVQLREVRAYTAWHSSIYPAAQGPPSIPSFRTP